MKIGLTGATGFIGKRIVELAIQRGHEVVGFTRDPSRAIPGCVETRKFSVDERVDVAGCEAIIHLAGEPVFGLWTKERRLRIRDSRVPGTRRLVNAIRASEKPPGVLVSGSAIGYYGDTGEYEVDETSRAGSGFLAEVCRAWETEALRAQEKNVRIVLLRSSVVLGRNGGAMKAMLPAFRAGLGGKLGSGRQWMSWIHIDDEAALALFALEHGEISGALNAVAPHPCRNDDFTQALAGALGRPAFLRVPAFALKMALGEFSHELLGSKRIVSKRIPPSGFTHRFPSLDAALADVTR